jgi:hypothetical protein
MLNVVMLIVVVLFGAFVMNIKFYNSDYLYQNLYLFVINVTAKLARLLCLATFIWVF